MPLGDVTLMLETAGEPAVLERAARQELKQYDSRIRKRFLVRAWGLSAFC
jgi:hypothetical protein